MKSKIYGEIGKKCLKIEIFHLFEYLNGILSKNRFEYFAWQIYFASQTSSSCSLCLLQIHLPSTQLAFAFKFTKFSHFYPFLFTHCTSLFFFFFFSFPTITNGSNINGVLRGGGVSGEIEG
jgi:hypothetical protein